MIENGNTPIFMGYMGKEKFIFCRLIPVDL
ncbi:MAG: hypothetical protein RL762_1730 [Bacteroidota bacterium]|jgi:hypothetical protein